MPQVTQKSVEGKAVKWQKRIGHLYSYVKDQLSDVTDIQFSLTRSLTMYEDLMRRNDVEPLELPILDVFVSGELKATFKPVGLWVVGANGRVDVLTNNGAYILTGTSDELSESSWEIYTPNKRKIKKSLDRGFLRAMVLS